jgi:hypothetical protein
LYGWDSKKEICVRGRGGGGKRISMKGEGESEMKKRRKVMPVSCMDWP